MCPAQAKPTSAPDANAGRALIEAAGRLRASLAAGVPAPLRGRHVAIAADHHDKPSARLFERAAAALGARVSHIGAGALAVPAKRQDTAARLLGSLYDAIDFIPLSPERAESLRQAAGVPVFADLGGEHSPLQALVTAHASPADREAELLGLVQAVLVEALR